MWIEVRTKESARDVRKEGLQQAIMDDLGLKAQLLETSDIYAVDGSYSTREAELIGKAMSDEIVQDFSINSQLYSKGAWIIMVRYKPQITDPVEQSVLKLIEDLGLAAHSATVIQKYTIKNATEKEVMRICNELLANENTQQYGYGFEHVNVSSFLKAATAAPAEENGELAAAVKIRKASDAELRKISQKNVLSLSLEEMKAIQAYFRKLRREPTDVELETLAQTWSEHCKHKTFNSEIELEMYNSSGKKVKTEVIGSLFKETIVAATNEIAKRKEWKNNLTSVFKDNAGIIKFDDDNCIAFKVETHNHPSALDPYGGAGTGIGGVIRDVLGAGLGAKPVFSTDVFCFANPDYGKNGEDLPKGVIHPKRTFKGVVAGVRDYGNRMGIPTINGSITFHDSYLAPLVYCGTAGIMPKWAAKKEPKNGDLIVVVGGKTGKDGLHGATFSSTELKEGLTTSVVQIGNAIEEKKMLDAILEARDKRLFTAITDCGAGGFSSAVGEMGKELGAEVELAEVPLKHKGMKPWEIWLSESQERMVLAVPEKNLQRLREICSKEETGLAVIGRFTATKKLVVNCKGKAVAELDMGFLHNGLPRQKRRAVYREKEQKSSPQLQRKNKNANYNEVLKKLLAMPSIASKEWVIRQYDHEVQANTVIKPLIGAANDGPSDASVVRPVFGSRKAVAVANGINPRYGLLSPYWMAAAAIDEALRNIVATGGSLGKTAILDNFCWANTDDEEKLGTLVMAAKACKDFAVAYGTPFISGKDSLHNEVVSGGKKIPVLDTLLISAVAIIDDIENIVTMDAKKEGSSIYAIGETKNEMGGSHHSELAGIGLKEGDVPTIDAAKSKATFAAVEEAIKEKTVLACHDVSEGGLAVALAEMCFAGGIGAEVELRNVPHTKPFYEKGLSKNGDEIVLFSESQTRFVAEVGKGKEEAFESVMNKNGCSYGLLGKTKGKRLIIRGSIGKLIDSEINELKNAWQSPLRW